MTDKHFFQRKRTYAFIGRMGVPMDWTIYVGLGATYDRTNLSWESLITRLFTRFDIGIAEATEWVSRVTPVHASTTLEALYIERYKRENYIKPLREDIRRELYGPRRIMQGRLLTNLTNFAMANAQRGRSVALVTSNYDEYLYAELKAWQEEPVSTPKRTRKPILNENTVIETGIEDLPRNWDKRGAISSIHIHGYIPEEAECLGKPVLGEMSYQESAPRTERVLNLLFEDRNILIVGSSLSDGPLVNALIESKTSLRERFVIQPLQGDEWKYLPRDRRADVLALNAKRVQALGLESITPDFFGQVGQLLAEASSAIREEESPEELLKPQHPRRYDRRLDAWWDKWSACCDKSASTQLIHHKLLQLTASSVRKLLGADTEEELKVEVWARWAPGTERMFALWASSVGSWSAFDSLRKDSIAIDSDYRAIRVFCAGASQLLHEDECSRGRWKSYFGIPIWIDSMSGQLPVGVVTVASMWSGVRRHDDHELGCLREANMQQIAQAAMPLQFVGKQILELTQEEEDLTSLEAALKIALP